MTGKLLKPVIFCCWYKNQWNSVLCFYERAPAEGPKVADPRSKQSKRIRQFNKLWTKTPRLKNESLRSKIITALSWTFSRWKQITWFCLWPLTCRINPFLAAGHAAEKRTRPFLSGQLHIQPLVWWLVAHPQLHLQQRSDLDYWLSMSGWKITVSLKYFLNVAVSLCFTAWRDKCAVSGEVTYRSKYLKSDTYRRNIKADKIVVSEFGTMIYPDPCKNIFARWQYIQNMEKLISVQKEGCKTLYMPFVKTECLRNNLSASKTQRAKIIQNMQNLNTFRCVVYMNGKNKSTLVSVHVLKRLIWVNSGCGCSVFYYKANTRYCTSSFHPKTSQISVASHCSSLTD